MFFFRGIDELCIFVDAQIDYRKNSGKSLGVIGNWLYMKWHALPLVATTVRLSMGWYIRLSASICVTWASIILNFCNWTILATVTISYRVFATRTSVTPNGSVRHFPEVRVGVGLFRRFAVRQRQKAHYLYWGFWVLTNLSPLAFWSPYLWILNSAINCCYYIFLVNKTTRSLITSTQENLHRSKGIHVIWDN